MRSVLVDEAVAVVVDGVRGILPLKERGGNHRAVAFADNRATVFGGGAVPVVVDAVLGVAGRFQKSERGRPHRVRPEKFVAYAVHVRHERDVLQQIEIGNVVAAIAAYAVRQPHGEARLANIAGAVVLGAVNEKDHVLNENLAPGQHPNLGDKPHTPAADVGRVGEIRGIPIILVVADLVKEFLVGVEHVLPEKAVPGVAPARILYVAELVRPGGGPGRRLVRLRNAVFGARRIHVPLDWLERPRNVVVYGIPPKIGHVHDPQRVVVFVLDLGAYPQLGQGYVAAARVFWPFVPEISRIPGLPRLRPVGDGGADVVGVDVVAAALERIDALRAGHMVPVYDALGAGGADKRGGQRDEGQRRQGERGGQARKRPPEKAARRPALSCQA